MLLATLMFFIVYLDKNNVLNVLNMILFYLSIFVLDVEIYILEKYPFCDFLQTEEVCVLLCYVMLFTLSSIKSSSSIRVHSFQNIQLFLNKIYVSLYFN